jgi:hypothetical protein
MLAPQGFVGESAAIPAALGYQVEILTKYEKLVYPHLIDQSTSNQRIIQFVRQMGLAVFQPMFLAKTRVALM